MVTALRTARLVLREWRDEDVAAFAAMSADPVVMRYLVPFADQAAMDAWVTTARAHWLDHGFGQWVVELPGEASFIGVVGLSNLRFALPFAPAVEVAWRLARAYWGMGYACEACRNRWVRTARPRRDRGFHRAGEPAVAAGDGKARHDP